MITITVDFYLVLLSKWDLINIITLSGCLITLTSDYSKRLSLYYDIVHISKSLPTLNRDVIYEYTLVMMLQILFLPIAEISSIKISIRHIF